MMKKLSLYVDEKVWARFRARAILKGRKVQPLVAELLIAWETGDTSLFVDSLSARPGTPGSLS